VTATFVPRGAVRHLRSADADFSGLIEKLGPLPVHPFFTGTKEPVFVSLAHSITHQQLGNAAAEAIYGRLRKTLHGRLTPARLLAAKVPALRAAGLSRGKIKSLQDLAERTLDGTVPRNAQMLRLSDDEIIQRITAVHGIGRWTVEMLLLKAGRPDVLPTTDLGIRRGFGIAFGNGELAKPKEIEGRGEAWRPFRSVASFYLWRANGLR
jgi:3-methyladenine DNA glycosylase/8-oxoguanine DNA glycosylase